MKVNAATRLEAAKRDKDDAERYRAIRAQVQSAKTLTLKAAADDGAFDRMIDKVLRS